MVRRYSKRAESSRNKGTNARINIELTSKGNIMAAFAAKKVGENPEANTQTLKGEGNEWTNRRRYELPTK